jgi:hypothetical protein
MPPEHGLAFWQIADYYFRARMPVFGIALQLALLLNIAFMYQFNHTFSFWLLVIAFVLMIAEIIIIKKMNLPLNIIIQNIKGNEVPADFETLRSSAIKIFSLRTVIGITSFILVLLSCLFYQEFL